MTRIFTSFILLLWLSVLCGCAGQFAYWEGKKRISGGDVEGGIEKLKDAVAEAPTNAEYRQSYLSARENAVNRWLDLIARARSAGNEEEINRLIGRILVQDPNNARIREIQNEMRRETREKETLTQAQSAWSAGDVEAAQSRLRGVLAENPKNGLALTMARTIQEASTPMAADPKLSQGMRKSLSIEFTEAPIRQVFEVFSRTSGLNFVFDKDVRPDQKTTVFLKNTTIEDAVNLILFTNQLDKRVLDQNSILIYPNTPPKVREYQELSLKSFFLSNSEAKNVGNTIKTLLKTKDVVIDEQQNMLILRDTPEAIRLAEKLVALHEQPQPEVMLEVEVLEVKRSNLMNLGIQWPGQLSLTPLASKTGGPLTLADLKSPPTGRIGATIDPVIVNASKTNGNTNILANPRIRTRARETAKIMIGERLPNITTTATATGFVSENIQYIDVGLKLEVQPTIYPDNEVAIKLALEVSSVGRQITTKSGSTAYQIGTRTASTVLRLKDGENQILAGLINDEERVTANKIPGLGDIPILGRLFGSQTDDGQKTEIVLSITPRLIRNMARPSLLDSEFESGTEASFKVRTGRRGSSLPPAGNMTPAPAQPQTEAPTGDPTTMSWQGPSQVKAGETITLTLSVTPGQPLVSVPCSIAYDPRVFDVVSASPGDVLKQDGAATNFSSHIDREKGIISAMQARVDSGGATAPGELVKVNLLALKASEGSSVRVTNAKPTANGGMAVEVGELPGHIIVVTP